MAETNILFDSFSVGKSTSIGSSGTLFGSSISAERSASSNLTGSSSGSSSSNSSITSSGGNTITTASNSLNFNNGPLNNGSSSSNNSSIRKTPPTPSSPISSNNNNKSSPTDNNSFSNNVNNGGSGGSSPRSLDRSPSHDLWRSTSSGGMALHGLDLSKPPSLLTSSSLNDNENIKKETSGEDNNDDSASAGLDLSKPETSSLGGSGNGMYRRTSDLESTPFTNGMHSDPPTPLGGDHAPLRSLSSGSAADNADAEDAEENASPFSMDSVLNGRSSASLTNGENTLSLSTGQHGSADRPSYMKSSPKIPPDPYNLQAFDDASPPPLKFKDPYLVSKPPPLFDLQTPPTSESHHKPPTSLAPSSKFKDSCIAKRLADNSFLKPLNSYSKLLEGYGQNARINSSNNNNNNSTSNNNNNHKHSSGVAKTEAQDSPYGKIAESYAKQIENLANGYKSDSSFFGKDGGLFKSDAQSHPPSSIGSFPKLEASLTNGIGAPPYGGGKSEAVTSSSASASQSPGANSLPSILNFSTNHLRGMAAADGGLASYLGGYGVGGPLSGSLSGGGSGSTGSSGDSRAPGGGSSQSEGGMSRASPNNKLACRFCGKTFSQAGYIKAHERLHTGEKPFACSVCGKRFSDPSNWKKHERVHANNKKTGSGGHVTGLDHSESKVGVGLLCHCISFIGRYATPLAYAICLY
ncbi:Zinc finger protein 787 [Plakobranchus ocellatus]|uniref:Zinc finger protein 787 n=1 Tax=Plakobranchus ocellatus TaxID=259542 RepID=A0AAV4BRN9_9GAST|nr:Zinc finger protein 787 [Plakobranchus ocellatus]